MDRRENNKRIAKNTVILYGRMLVTMLVSLYTSRVVIDALGFTDYGIYNLVGSVVAMFTVFTNSLSVAIGRFLTFELGRGNKETLRSVFSMSINILFIAALAIAAVTEVAGVWYMYHGMVLPPDRLEAAQWAFHCSIATFVISFLNVPYNSIIVAHERMSVYAYMTILDVLFKLLIAWAIVVSPIDKLIAYALLMLGVNALMRVVYMIYCRHHFAETKYKWGFDHQLLKSMGIFAGWNLFGSFARMARESGLNVILNHFGGPVVNAARGIANTVSSATRSLAGSFMASTRPQITKTYAAGEHDYCFTLVNQCTRLSFALMFIVMLPIMLDTHYVLSLWLKDIPEHAVWFVRLTLLYTIVDSFRPALDTLMQATGHVGRDKMWESIFMVATLPASYIMLWLGFVPEWTMLLTSVAMFFIIFAKLWILHNMITFPVWSFLGGVWLRSVIVAIVAIVLPAGIYYTMEESLLRFLILGTVCVTTTGMSLFWIGCNRSERIMVISYIKKRMKR